MASVSKRQFLRSIGGAGAAAVLSAATWQRLFAETAAIAPADLAKDDGFWESIRKRYLVTPDFIQLENGYYSLTAEPVLDSYIRHVRQINATSSFYMRTKQVDVKLAVRHDLARLLGCADGEVIITRNTTESLDTVIGGFDWKAGDVAGMAEQDYGSMLDMFKLQARRHGIVNRMVSVPMQPKADDEIVAVYENAITPKTRLLMVCHMINITGQILPVRRIVEMAHRHGVQVMVDGAHTFGQLDFTIGDLGGCDYYGSSLHKWLGAPLGAGILYVRRDRVAPLGQLIGDATFTDNDNRKPVYYKHNLAHETDS
jgi:selenocysteine lyase/cysteine desulfurase